MRLHRKSFFSWLPTRIVSVVFAWVDKFRFYYAFFVLVEVVVIIFTFFFFTFICVHFIVHFTAGLATDTAAV